MDFRAGKEVMEPAKVFVGGGWGRYSTDDACVVG